MMKKQRNYNKLLFSLLLIFMVMATSKSAVAQSLVCEQDRCVIKIHETLGIEAAYDAFIETVERIELSGDAVLKTPTGDLPLLNASLVFEPRPDLPEVAFDMYGTAMAPFPEFPIFDGAVFRAEPMAAVGIASRDTLKSLLENGDNTLPLAENPIDPEGDPEEIIEPAYLFFHYESGLSFDLALGEALGLNQEEGAHDPFSFSVPGDKSVTFLLDPTDPYFFLSSDAREFVVDSLEKSKKLVEEANKSESTDSEPDQNETPDSDNNGEVTTTDTGDPKKDADKNQNESKDKDTSNGPQLPELGSLAFSWLGGIPFEPETTWGLPEGAGRFKGNLYVDATIPLSSFVELSGPIVTKTYAGEDGFEFQQGGNGEVAVAFDLIPGILAFSFPLGHASAGVKIADDEQMTYFSGINSPDYSFLPSIVPMVPANESQVAGYISSENPEDTRLHARGQFSYNLEGLRELTGVDLSNLAVSEAELNIDVRGIWLTGKTTTSIHPSIAFGGEVIVDAYFSPTQPEDAYLEMSGMMEIYGVGLKPVRLRVDKTGLEIEGQFVTPISTIGMFGEIKKTGPSLTGVASLRIPLDVVNEAINEVRADLNAAQKEVERITLLIDKERKAIQRERDENPGKLEQARRDAAKVDVNIKSYQSKISAHRSGIAKSRKAIKKKQNWYKRQAWYKKSWAYAKYRAYSGSHYRKISNHGKEIKRLTAELKKQVEKAKVLDREEILLLVPVNDHPRVLPLIELQKVALDALAEAETALPELPIFDADIEGKITFTLDVKGIRGAVNANVNGKTIADGTVELGENPKACINLIDVGEVCAPF